MNIYTSSSCETSSTSVSDLPSSSLPSPGGPLASEPHMDRDSHALYLASTSMQGNAPPIDTFNHRTIGKPHGHGWYSPTAYSTTIPTTSALPSEIEKVLASMDPSDVTIELLNNLFNQLYIQQQYEQCPQEYSPTGHVTHQSTPTEALSSQFRSSLSPLSSASTSPTSLSPLHGSKTGPSLLRPHDASTDMVDTEVLPFTCYDRSGGGSGFAWSPRAASVCRESDESSDEDRETDSKMQDEEEQEEQEEEEDRQEGGIMNIEFPRRQNKEGGVFNSIQSGQNGEQNCFDDMFTLQMQEEEEDDGRMPLWFYDDDDENDDDNGNSDKIEREDRECEQENVHNIRSASIPSSSSSSSSSSCSTLPTSSRPSIHPPHNCSTTCATWTGRDEMVGDTWSAIDDTELQILPADLSWLKKMDDDDFFSTRVLTIDDGAYIQVFSPGKNGWRPGMVLFRISDGRHAVAFVDGDIEHVDLNSQPWRYIS